MEVLVKVRNSTIRAAQRGVSTAVLLLLIAVVAVAARGGTALLTNIFDRKQEAAAPRRAWSRSTRTPPIRRQVGRQLAQAVRLLSAHRTADAHALRRPRRQRGAARPEDREGPVAEEDVPRLRLLDRLPRPPRPRLHAGRPGADRADEQAADGLLPALPCLGDAAVPGTGRRRRDEGLRGKLQVLVQGDQQEAARHGPRACGQLRRLPRCQDDAADRHAARLHPGHPGAGQLGAPTPFAPSIERWRATDKSKPYDPNKDATRTEMRSYVCAQCHVEYYCSTQMPLTLPWGKGLKMEQQEAFWNETKFANGERFFDYKHAETGAPILKAQHPEFELWSQGVHARSGVACADCHMPYGRDGATKVSDHWVRSPLLNISRACQTCHKQSEEEIKTRVDLIQQRNFDLLQRGGKAIVGAHRRHQRGEEGRRHARAAERCAGVAAQGAVAAGLHRGRELDGLPRAAGSRQGAGRSHRLRPPGRTRGGPGAGRHEGGRGCGANTGPQALGATSRSRAGGRRRRGLLRRAGHRLARRRRARAGGPAPRPAAPAPAGPAGGRAVPPAAARPERRGRRFGAQRDDRQRQLVGLQRLAFLPAAVFAVAVDDAHHGVGGQQGVADAVVPREGSPSWMCASSRHASPGPSSCAGSAIRSRRCKRRKPAKLLSSQEDLSWVNDNATAAGRASRYSRCS
jgi:hypothetical protein